MLSHRGYTGAGLHDTSANVHYKNLHCCIIHWV